MISNSSQNSSSASSVGFFNCSANENFLAARTAILVLEANQLRRYAAFINNSATDITIFLGSKEKAKVNHGIILKPWGGSFEINRNNLYQGPVSAISLTKCSLSFVECIE